MRVPQAVIDQILARVDLVELIGQRVKLKKSGQSYAGCCPFHQEKTPSFYVMPHKGFYHCFGCQASGNAIRFLMETEGRGFTAVLQDLAKRAGVELALEDNASQATTYRRQRTISPSSTPHETAASETTLKPVLPAEALDWQGFDTSSPVPLTPEASFTEPNEPQGNLYELLERICQFYQRALTQSPSAQLYLQQRGLAADTIAYWRIGYAPEGWQHLLDAFAEDAEGLQLLQLIRQSEQGHRWYCLLRHRIIFPIRDGRGRVVGFGGRALNNETKPKYINSPESPVFYKSQLLFGWYENRQARAKQVILTEGYLDVIALQQAGLAGAVASLGTAVSADHLKILFQHYSKIILAFDGDTSGQRAAWRTLNLALPLLSDGRAVHFLMMPEGDDPDSLIRQEGLSGFEHRLQEAPSLSDFLFQQLTHQADTRSPEGKALIMQQLRQLTQQMPRGNYPYLLSRFFSDRLNIRQRGLTQQAQQQPAATEFASRGTLENKLTALLLMYPQQVTRYASIHEWLPETHPLCRLTAWVQQFPLERLGPGDNSCLILGAWPDDEHKAYFLQVMEQVEDLLLDGEPGLLIQVTLLQCEAQTLRQRLRQQKQTLGFREVGAMSQRLKVLSQQLNQQQFDNVPG